MKLYPITGSSAICALLVPKLVRVETNISHLTPRTYTEGQAAMIARLIAIAEATHSVGTGPDNPNVASVL